MLGLQVDLAQNVWKDATSKQTDGQTGIRQVGKPENMDHRDAGGNTIFQSISRKDETETM